METRNHVLLLNSRSAKAQPASTPFFYTALAALAPALLLAVIVVVATSMAANG